MMNGSEIYPSLHRMRESRYSTKNQGVSSNFLQLILFLESSFSEMWLTNKDRNPLGHFSIMPRFDGDQFPFVTCTSLRGIILVNLKENHAETLIDATSTCAWG